LFFDTGKITKLGAEYVQFRISGLEDLKVIINNFDKFPLVTNKQSDYLVFKQAVNFMQGKYLTIEGLNQIISIKAVLNKQNLSDSLKLALPNIETMLRPKIKNRKIKSIH